MSGDLDRAVAMLAADNCRLIDIALAADALALAAENLREADARDVQVNWRLKILSDALDAFKIVKAGQ